jgi:hypothetical protein
MSMDECACLYGGYDGEDDYDEDGNQLSRTSTVQAVDPLKCCECHGTIDVGQMHEHHVGYTDGREWSYDTCLVCAEIRSALYCEGWFFTMLWEDIEEQIFEERGLTQACLDKLTTPTAKRALQDAWMAFVGSE